MSPTLALFAFFLAACATAAAVYVARSSSDTLSERLAEIVEDLRGENKQALAILVILLAFLLKRGPWAMCGLIAFAAFGGATAFLEPDPLAVYKTWYCIAREVLEFLLGPSDLCQKWFPD